MVRFLPLPALPAILFALSCAQPAPDGAGSAEVEAMGGSEPALTLTAQSSGTDVLLQALSPVDESVVWVSGHGGTWGRSLDGGETWTTSVMVGQEELQFRDVDAMDASTAFLMSAGTGEQSRIYRTDDAGASWRLQYMATDAAAFLDCMAFWDRDRGVAYGDAIDGVPFILRTEDGESWARVPAAGLPAALEGEGGFAASGSCVETRPGGAAWIATGNGSEARVLRTADHGERWDARTVPVVGGAASGLTSVRFVDERRGLAVGGVVGGDTLRVAGVAVSTDAGATWSEGGLLAMRGPAYGSAAVRIDASVFAVAVGPGGMDRSDDGGLTWSAVSDRTYWAVSLASDRVGWAVGPGGRIDRLSIEPGG